MLFIQFFINSAGTTYNQIYTHITFHDCSFNVLYQLISKPKLFKLIAYSELGLEGKTKLSRRQGTFYMSVIVTRESAVLEILVFKELNMVG